MMSLFTATYLMERYHLKKIMILDTDAQPATAPPNILLPTRVFFL